MLYRTVLVAVGIWVLTAPITKAAEPFVIDMNRYYPPVQEKAAPDLGPKRIPWDQAEDLIATQPKHAEVIGPPLSHHAHNCTPDPSKDLPDNPGPLICMDMDEFQVMREALWVNQMRDIERFKWTYDQPAFFQELSIIHLEKGLPLRVGDYLTLHGSLLGALRLDTFILAKKWQSYRKCFSKEPECVGY